jgi:hypothetical protein
MSYSPWLGNLIENRNQAKRHLAWIRKHGVANFDKRLTLSGLYLEPKKKWRLNLSDKTSVDHAVVTTEDTGFLVSILKEPNQNKESYVEINVTEGHHMFERISDAISVLNIAGALTEVSGVGEMFQEGVYHVVLTKEEHTAFLKG